MEFMGITGIAAITVICYLVAELIKVWEVYNKWIPTVCGVLGGCLGVVALFIMPEFPAVDYITAIAIGIVSGLAATGANQVVKQLGK